MRDIDDCEIHGCGTVLRVLRVADPIKATLKQTPAYLRAKRTHFPYCDDVVEGSGIRLAAKTACMPVCVECCARRDRFLLTEYPVWSRTHELAS